MQFLTLEQCRERAAGSGHRLGASQEPLLPSEEIRHLRLAFPPEHTRLTWFCRHIEQSLQPRDSCLLWLTEWGIWPSSENWHLYYRLRQSYGDQRLLHEAPGHLFLDYEVPEVISFLQLAVLSGWGGHLLPAGGFARAFFSHDEFIEFAADDPAVLASFAENLRAVGSRTSP